MAAIQTIRKRGKILASIVGLALFAFVAEEGVRMMSSRSAEARQQVGKVCGEKISYQDFQALVAEMEDIVMMSRGISSLTDEQHASIREQVWQQYVREITIQKECEELGLTVTDAEMQHVLTVGTNPLLRQTPFTNQQTGTFDATMLKQFMDGYNQAKGDPSQAQLLEQQYEPLMKYWRFTEKQLRSSLLMSKYQALLGSSLMSNKVSAKAAFDARTAQATILLAGLPYSSMSDTEVEVTEQDKQNKWNELKEQFYNQTENREIEMIDIPVTASQADKDELLAEMNEIAGALSASENIAKTIRESASLVTYSTMPVKKTALPNDVAGRLDSMSAGSQIGPYTNAGDNTMNIVRLIAKTEQPDSIEMRQIMVAGSDMAAARKTADSIVNAIQGGAVFDSIAARYNQQGAKTWITGQSYEGATLDEMTAKVYRAFVNNAAGSLDVIELEGGYMVLNVTDRRDFKTKYDVAIVKREITFSKDTYTDAYNKLSQFLAENQTAALVRENAAKKGYNLIPVRVAQTDHYVGGVHSTRDALRWIFNEDTNVDAVSQLYECGDNDHLMMCILKSVTPVGYMPATDAMIEPYLNAEVAKDKKADKFKEMMASAKSAAEVAKLKNAISDTLTHVTFANPVFVSRAGARETVLCGAVAGLKKGESSAAVKGNGAVYIATVLDTQKSAGEYNEKNEIESASRMLMSNMRNLEEDLKRQADIEDHRYIFF